ncbi:hypothetical protein Tco_0034106 [Tanacetum coccineum]
MAGLNFADSHNMVAYLEKSTENADFAEIVDFLNSNPIRYALTVSPTIYVSCIEQFWSTTKTKIVNNETQIHAKVEGKTIVISESSVRRDLQFDDEDGIACLTNTKIFENLQLMGYEKLSEKLTFYKPYFSPQWKYLIHTILQCLSSKSTAWNEFGTNIASAAICLAKNQKFNFSKLIFDGMIRNLDSSKKFLIYPRFLQLFLNKQIENLSEVNAVYDTPSHTKKIFANMRRQGKDFSGAVTPLFSSLLAQQADMDETVTKEREDRMERAATTASSLEAEQDGDMDEVFKDVEGDAEQVISAAVDEVPTGDAVNTDGTEVNTASALVTTVGVSISTVEPITTASVNITTVEPITPPTTTTIFEDEDLTIAQTLVKMRSEKLKIRGVVMQEPSETTTRLTVPPQQHDPKDKGKGKMVEQEKPLKKKDQIKFDEEIAQRLQTQMQVELEEEERLAREREEDANITEWDNAQAMMDDDYELAARIQAQEHEELTIEEK